MKTQTERPELMTVSEVADVLRLGRTKVNSMLWSGDLPSVKLGRRRLIRREDLEQFIREQQASE